ncbi:MAG: carotenoid oxygenase family protein [Actinomycetota bacterium]|nr:carotenoid oxygenase family protein [Actinomycetota bacterium]
MFHPLNAYDTDDGRVIIDLCRYERMFEKDLFGPFGDSMPTLDRWEIDPVVGTVTETRIDDRPQEFPRHNNSVGGRKHRYGYTAAVDLSTEGQMHGPIYKIDFDSGAVSEHDFGPGRGGAEPLFVADPQGAAEDDGWILTVVYDLGTDSSELHVLDARDVAGPAVAVISLPQRVPFGFHGNWVSG